MTERLASGYLYTWNNKKVIILCFLGCKALESITIPDSVTSVGDMAFAVCLNLKEIAFGPNLERIGMAAFQACQALEKVTIPEGTEVAENAFLGCSPDLEIIRVKAE
jgi:hypothetical protein